MKTVILAGGLGSRLGDETAAQPKALVTIGGRPILSHIMRVFMVQGHFEFVVATGFGSASIVDYFSAPNDLFECPETASAAGYLLVSAANRPGVRVELIETGPDTASGGRVLRLRPFLPEERIFLAWCDGLADIDLGRLLDFHLAHGKIATVTAVRPPARFGRLTLEGDRVLSFDEKPDSAKEWINGGVFILEPNIMEFIESDTEMFESGALTRLASAGELMAYRHLGFWDCMDTPADRDRLEELWRLGAAPWHPEGRTA